MGRFETENQMRDATMTELPKEGAEVRRPIYTNYLKKGAGANNQQLRRKEFRARRGDELRGLLGREVLGGQQLMLTQQQQFGAQPGLQQQSGARGIEARLLSKPPLRHWGYEPALVRQADIDQAPNFKRRVPVQRQRAQRIHRVRRGVAWDIPVYDRERHEKGGLAWTIPMDSDMYAASSGKKKASKSKSLLKRFAAGVKRVFKGRRATTKEPKVTVRPQQRLVARKRGAPYIARSQVPPQAPIVEKKRLRKTENTTGVELRKQEAFARAPGVVGAPAGVAASGIVAAPVVEDRGMFVNGRRIHTTHLSEVPLMRQAPALDKDDSAQKVEAPRTAAASHAAPVAHTKGHAITAQHEQRLQHVRTG